MKKIVLDYPIIIGSDLLANINELFELSKYSRIVLLTDHTVPNEIIDRLSLGEDLKVIKVKPGEANKNISSLQEIWKTLLGYGCDRKSLLINLGGGVIGDMGGFAAATYMRGMDFLQIPTTLLSQVDASVGGKVGVDFGGLKNLIGSFNDPIGVVVDVETLRTLPKREFVSGFAEIIKHGLIKDRKYFELVTSKGSTEFSEEELVDIIYKSCEIKADVVRQDRKEGGVRKLLNFGHTVGHALETLSLETEKPMLHGEAVALGMVIEAEISKNKGLFGVQEFEDITNKLKNSGLLEGSWNFDIEAILKKISRDKKGEKGEVKWTLLKQIGEGVIDQNVSRDEVRNAFRILS